MKRLMFTAAGALVCLAALAFPAASEAQENSTTVTVSSVIIGVNGISGATGMQYGTVCATPANAQGVPITVTAPGWGLIPAGRRLCGRVLNGGISGGFNVPDAAHTNLANPIAYNFTIQQTDANGNPIGQPTAINGVTGVTGSTFALDTYSPPASAPASSPGLVYGTSVPSQCTSPSILTTPSGPYYCSAGVYVSFGGAGSFSSGGDIGGTSGSLVVRGIQGRSVSSAAPVSGQYLAFNGSSYAPLTPPVPGNAGHVIYQAAFWGDLSGFTQAGSDFTIVNNQIAANGVPGDFAHYIAVNGTNNDDQSVDFEVTFLVNSSQPGGAFCVGGAGQNYGIAIGKIGSSTESTDSVQAFLAGEESPDDALKLMYNGTQIPGTSTSYNPSCMAPGDYIRLVYSQRVNVITMTYDNYTQGTHNSTTYTDPMTAATHYAPNSSRFAIWLAGGSFQIQNIKLISRQPATPRVAFLGDSKTYGFNSATENQRFASLLKAYGPTAVYAGQGDITADLLADLPYILRSPPQYAVLCIGYNDIGYGIASATWQANYASITSQLQAAGVNVIHLLSIPTSNGLDVSGLNSYITSHYSNTVDPSVGWSNSLYISSDTVHPSPLGHAFVAAKIAGSGKLPSASVAVSDFTPPSPASLYPGTVATTSGAGPVTSTANPATITATSPATASCATSLSTCTSAYGTVLITPNSAAAGGVATATWGTLGHTQACSAYQMGGTTFHAVGGYTSTDNGATEVVLSAGSPGSDAFYIVYSCH